MQMHEQCVPGAFSSPSSMPGNEATLIQDTSSYTYTHSQAHKHVLIPVFNVCYFKLCLSFYSLEYHHNGSCSKEKKVYTSLSVHMTRVIVRETMDLHDVVFWSKRSCSKFSCYLFVFVNMTILGTISLVPRPRPAFCHLQYGKVWRAWYLFSREHDVIGKWRKFSERTDCVSSIVQPTTRSTLGVYDNRPPLARYVR